MSFEMTTVLEIDAPSSTEESLKLDTDIYAYKQFQECYIRPHRASKVSSNSSVEVEDWPQEDYDVAPAYKVASKAFIQKAKTKIREGVFHAGRGYRENLTSVGGCWTWPHDVSIEDALQILDTNNWENAEDFLNPWGWQHVTLVHLASYRGDTEMLERAVALYANRSTVLVGVDNTNDRMEPMLAVDRLGRCALHYAALEGHGKMVSWILEHAGREYSTHPQLSLEDVFGGTPLHDATLGLHADVVKLLVDAGASVNIRNKRGLPPFLPIQFDQYALDADQLTQYEKIVEIYIAAKVRVNFAHPTTGRTMLHRAVMLNSQKTTRLLLQHGADPGHKSSTAVTPVHIAAENGYHTLLCELLQKLPLSSIDTPNKTGLSPLQLAAIIGNLECVRELVNKGGNLARRYPSSNRTVIDALLDLVYERDVVTFFKDLLDAQIRSLMCAKNEAILNYEVLAPQGEPQMAVVVVLMEAMKTTELQRIVQHPLLQAYIGKMLLRFSNAFYWFAILSMVFVISLCWHTIDVVHNNSDTWSRRSMLCAASILLVNFLQFLVKPKWYFRRLENWLALISLTMAIVVAISGELTSYASRSWVLQCLSVTNPLAAIQMMIFLSRSPASGYYVLLLFIVLKRVLKVLLIGLSIIAGFSLSFLILFHNNDQFDNPWKAFSKTIVMMTGEYEYGDLFALISANGSKNHNPDSEYIMYNAFPSVIGRIVLIIFVILTSIVLMNLMISLAVSDAQMLANEGQFGRLLNQVQFIADCERMTKNRFFRRVWVPLCIPQWVVTTKICNQETIWLPDSPPSHISKEVWRDIYLLCKNNRERDGNSQKSESRSDNEADSLATMRAALAAMQSSQQSIISELRQIRQLIEIRGADDDPEVPRCSRMYLIDSDVE